MPRLFIEEWQQNISRFKRAVKCEAFYAVYWDYINSKIINDYPNVSEFTLKPNQFIEHFADLSYRSLVVEIIAILESDVCKPQHGSLEPLNLSTLLLTATEKFDWFKQNKNFLQNNLDKIRDSYGKPAFKDLRTSLVHGVYNLYVSDNPRQSHELACFSIWNDFLIYFKEHAEVDFDYGSYFNTQKEFLSIDLKKSLESIQVIPRIN